VISTLRAQLERFLHTCFSVVPYEAYVKLAERLNELTPGNFPKKTLLINTGAEAVENAVKLARAYTRRPAIIAFEHAFHGRTLMALSLTSKTHPYKAGFGPFASDVYRIPFGYCYHCAAGEAHSFCPASTQPLEEAFRHSVAAESVAALIAEPVLGEGGFMAPPTRYFRDLMEICHANGILFIADEVQSGIARTGTLFACEQYGIEPDLLVAAKSLGGGLPIASVTGRAEIMDIPESGGIGGTFGGNPLACEAALAVLEIVEKENLCARANAIGNKFLEIARRWQQRWPQIRTIHGLGAMRAIELWDPESHAPAAEETRAITKYCYEHGLILLSTGTYANVLRLLMPLIVTDEQLAEGFAIMESALQHVLEPATAETLKARHA
jgi:4-aminobutyrate aminotransferase/(S)-3-amino-2-methylpropionate transaminase